MKIADSDSIKAGEQELISSIMERLNPETLSHVASKTLSPEQMEFVNGDMVIHDNRIVYKMDFKVTLDLSVMFDRNGELVVSSREDAGSTYVQAENMDSFSEEWEDVSDDPAHGDDDLIPQNEDHGDNPLPLEEDDMAQVLTRTRDFWQKKGEEAIHTPEAG